MDIIFTELKKILPLKLISELEEEYNQFKYSYYRHDLTKCGIHAGRFCELTICLISSEELGQDIDFNNIRFNQSIEMLVNSTKDSAKDDLLKLIIPRILRSIYTLRNKKKIAHIKDFNPQSIDIKYINIALDWVISQLLFIYCNVSDIRIIETLEKISFKDFSKVERFENGEILFEDDISLPNQILYSLIEFYNKKRVSKEYIIRVLAIKNKNYFSTALQRLKERKLVHICEDGITLTKWGINKLEGII